MNKDINPKQPIMSKIQKILLKEWDPIGVQDIPEAQDEYDAYIPSIYKIIQSKKSESELFDYLWRVETEHMGLSGNRKHTQAAARKLFELSAIL